jgi:hypothetical protein
MTDWAVSIQTAMAGLTLTPTGQRQVTVTKLTLSQTTQHNGVMKMAMATVATSVETMQMNVRMRQALPTLTELVVLTETMTGTPMQAIRSRTIQLNGPTVMVTTVVITQTETILMPSPMTLHNGRTPTVTAVVTIQTDSTVTLSGKTLTNGKTAMVMAMEIISSTLMAMESLKVILTSVRSCTGNQRMR